MSNRVKKAAQAKLKPNKPATEKVDCPDCDGKGINMAVSDKEVCTTCNGSGKVTVR